MPTPTLGKLQAALNALRHAAESVKNWEPGLVGAVEEAIAAHLDTIRQAELAEPEAAARRERIVRQCAEIGEAIARVRRYPEHIMARAVVIDRIGALARLIRQSPESLTGSRS